MRALSLVMQPRRAPAPPQGPPRQSKDTGLLARPQHLDGILQEPRGRLDIPVHSSSLPRAATPPL